MSLLLDALKKSGENQQSTGLSNLTLEDAPPPRAASTSSASASGRAAGETMFAAKKKKRSAGFTWNLGLVPSTLLFALIFGSGYGYYVWLEIQPPESQMLPPRPLPPATPITQTAPRVVVAAPAPELAPLVPTLKAEPAPTPAKVALPVVAAREENYTPRSKPRTSRPHSRPTDNNVVIHSKVKRDTITPTLLDAYQAYQRGDYVSASQSYRQVLGSDEHNRDALLGLAAIAQQLGQTETAQNYYRQLLLLNPRDPAAQAALTIYDADGGNTESRLKLLLSEQPRSGSLNFALGNYYADQSNWAEAQQSYFNAHTLEPANAQYAFNLAVSLDHLGQPKIAAQYYQQALQLDVSGHSGFDRTLAQRRLNELTQAR
jgi:Flp pilus assembly protein TadD